MRRFLKETYYKLPIVRELSALCAQTVVAKIAAINAFRQSLMNRPRYQDPRRLQAFEAQVYSQNFEDGILAEIFQRIGVESKFFVELGVGDGTENNTAFWMLQGWRGAWVEGDPGLTKRIARNLATPIAAGRLKVKTALITAENVGGLFDELDVPKEFDLLSLDIDRNTYHVWAALKAWQPRVVVVEYNAAFPASVDWVVDYQADRVWNHSVYFGASLKAYERLGRSLGYELVACDLSGTNAFFVRNDQDLGQFASPFTAENHHEPPRYWMCRREAHATAFGDDPAF